MEALEASLQQDVLAHTLRLFLNDDEHQVLLRCFGLEDWDGIRRTHEEVAEQLGRTADWVSRVEARALRKLRGRRGLSDLLLARGFTGY